MNELARRLVVPPHRTAAQAQFVPVPMPQESTGAPHPRPDTTVGTMNDDVPAHFDSWFRRGNLVEAIRGSPGRVAFGFSTDRDIPVALGHVTELCPGPDACFGRLCRVPGKPTGNLY
jgi:hypothetical protein